MSNVDWTSLPKRRGETLYSGDGGDTFDPMEARVAKLEGQFERLDDKIDEMRIDVAVLKERVSHLPGKGFIVSATIAALAFFSAVTVFQGHITALFGG